MSGVQLSLGLHAPAHSPVREVTRRYAAFLLATGRDLRAPQTQVDNAEFMAWIRRKWAEFAAAFGRSAEHHSEVDHIDFDNWLSKGGVQ